MIEYGNKLPTPLSMSDLKNIVSPSDRVSLHVAQDELRPLSRLHLSKRQHLQLTNMMVHAGHAGRCKRARKVRKSLAPSS